LSYIMTWFAMIIFGLSLFRFKIKDFLLPTIVSATALTQLSTVVQIMKHSYLMPILFPVFLCICLVIFFKIRIFQSLVIGISTFFVTVVVEVALNYFLAYFSVYEETLTYMLIGSCLISSVLLTSSYLFYKHRFGFTFLSKNNHTSTNIRKNSKTVITLTVIYLIFAPSSFFFSYLRDFLLVFSVIIICLLGYLLRAQIVKEMTEY
jgi:hypothetical protein